MVISASPFPTRHSSESLLESMVGGGNSEGCMLLRGIGNSPLNYVFPFINLPWSASSSIVGPKFTLLLRNWILTPTEFHKSRNSSQHCFASHSDQSNSQCPIHLRIPQMRVSPEFGKAAASPLSPTLEPNYNGWFPGSTLLSSPR